MKLSELITADILQQFRIRGLKVRTVAILDGSYVNYDISVYNVPDSRRDEVRKYVDELDDTLYHDKMVGPSQVMKYIISRKNTRQHYYKDIEDATKFDRRVHIRRVRDFTSAELMCMYMSDQITLLTYMLDRIREIWSTHISTLVLAGHKQR